MGNGNSRSRNVSNESSTDCNEEGICERVTISCVDGDCTETRTPLDVDETVEGGDDGTDGEEDGGDKRLDIDEVYNGTDEEVVEKKTFPIGIIISLVIFCILCIIGVILYVKKNKIPINSKIPKNKIQKI
jgi:hypothetical protein